MLKRTKLPNNAKKKRDGTWLSKDGRIYTFKNGVYRCHGEFKPTHGDCTKGKLIAAQVVFIKGQLKAGASQAWLSSKFGVSKVTIHHINENISWSDIEAPDMILEGPPAGTHKREWAEYLPYDE